MQTLVAVVLPLSLSRQARRGSYVRNDVIANPDPRPFAVVCRLRRKSRLV